jgi:hypothetical protein
MPCYCSLLRTTRLAKFLYQWYNEDQSTVGCRREPVEISGHLTQSVTIIGLAERLDQVLTELTLPAVARQRGSTRDPEREAPGRSTRKDETYAETYTLHRIVVLKLLSVTEARADFW